MWPSGPIPARWRKLARRKCAEPESWDKRHITTKGPLLVAAQKCSFAIAGFEVSCTASLFTTMKNLRIAMSLVLAGMGLASLAAAEEGLLATEPPKEITAQEIIKKLAAKEKEFKSVRKRCTYRQVIKIQQLDGDKPVGEYQQVADVTLDQGGKKVKNVVFAPQPSISISQEG